MWVAYDGEIANEALRLDYVERIDQHQLAAPLTGVATVRENQRWEHLYGVRFGPPELTFSGSHIASARVGVTFRAISGIQLTVDQSGGAAKRVSKIESYSPLHGPFAVARVSLADLTIDPGATMSVGFDVSVGEKYQFSFAETRDAQLSGGQFLQDAFASEPAPRRFCAINSASNVDGHLLAPSQIRPRAFCGTGSGAEPGNGGVVLFVAFEGSGVGAVPDNDSDWIYPVASGYNVSMVISSYCLMTRLVRREMQNAYPGAEFIYDNPDNAFLPVTSMTAMSGRLEPIEVSVSTAPFTAIEYIIEPSLADGSSGSTPFQIERTSSGLRVNWGASSFCQTVAPTLRTQTPEAQTALDYAWVVRGVRPFSAGADGGIVLSPLQGSPTWTKGVYRQGGVLDPAHYQHFPTLSAALVEGLASAVDEACSGGGSITSEFDSLRNSGLAFAGGRRLHLKAARLPNELTGLGHLASNPEAISVAPHDARVIAGDSVQFSVGQDSQDVDWSVVPLDGISGSVGSISPGGLYQAPQADEIKGSSQLAKVIASKDGQTGAALVSIVTQRVAINPLVFTTWPGGTVETRMAAGCVDGSTVNWEVRSVTGATLHEPVLGGDVLFDVNDRIYVAGAAPGDRYFSVDEITARSSTSGSSQTSYALVVEKTLSGELKIRESTDLPENQVQFDFDGGLGPIAGATWEVVAGAGSIDNNGLYTMDMASPHRFAVITAWIVVPQVGELCNYQILPLPLIDLSELNRILA
jgi:hypothetical protein